MEYKELIKTAIKYRERAYCGYSNFHVGSAVLFESGNIYGGCNIENSSYGATNCAERTAICKGISEGEKEIKAIAIVGDSKTFTYPCGICRQVIAEFAAKDIEIIIAKNEDEYIIKNLEEILPSAFTKEDLNK
jgi:cytidine deaminase